MESKLFLVVFAVVAVAVMGEKNPCDQQTETYTCPHAPVNASGNVDLMPVFSPFQSLNVYVELVENAQSHIEIATPHFKSFIECGNSYNQGCTVDVMRNNATDPLWPALLNAIHRGVKVTVLTNACGQYPAQGLIDPYAFLALSPGCELKSYTSTTFMHAKYISVDGEKTLISSINLSKSSLIDNREAGMLVQNGADGILAMWNRTFWSDFEQANEWKVQNYTEAQMSVIEDTAEIQMPPQPRNDCESDCCPPFSNKVFSSTGQMTGWTMPDFGSQELFAELLDNVKQSLDVSIYAVDSADFCDVLSEMHGNGIKLRLLVSGHTVGDFYQADACYKKLQGEGVQVQMTSRCLDFFHQKYWIVDGTKLSVSTGNWDDKDYPPSKVLPPYGSNNYNEAYRGFGITVEDPDVVSVFRNVMEFDWQQGKPWAPSDNQ
eukprot:TRINITY_DN5814_c0_g1_i1.p1 TRINITY_DN5814_c0_g1~~TRINITY_DN5814_c0_g1_i1.p1  ORF type:complete len:440 (-),score=113.94 TRINITY_DN5814_c0_g1_i1:64-1362(-)